MTELHENNRRRAAGMKPEDRRAMIIQAALPLAAERGAAVTTAEISAVAGVGEATIFRVFKDKEDLLEACIAEALRPDKALDAIALISLEQPLQKRLIEAADALESYVDRMGRVLGAMHASGYRAGRARRDGNAEADRPSREGGDERNDGTVKIRIAVAALFAPEQTTLRLAPDMLAGVFLDLLYARSRNTSGAGEPVCLAALTHLFLFGALDMSRAPAEFGEWDKRSD